MLYIKIEDGNPVGYPLTEQTLRDALPNVSFPAEINPEDLIPLGFAAFKITERPLAGIYQVQKELAPEFDGVATYTQKWDLEDMSDQEKELVNFNKLQESKSKQRTLLVESDWTELPSVRAKNTSEWAASWDAYRTALRDMDKAENWPFVTEWPVSPDSIPDVPPGESI